MLDKIISILFRKAPSTNRELPELDISELPTPLAAAEATYFASSEQRDLQAAASDLLRSLSKCLTDSAETGQNHLDFTITYGRLIRATRKTSGKRSER